MKYKLEESAKLAGWVLFDKNEPPPDGATVELIIDSRRDGHYIKAIDKVTSVHFGPFKHECFVNNSIQHIDYRVVAYRVLLKDPVTEIVSLDGWTVYDPDEPPSEGHYLVKNSDGQVRSMRFTKDGWTHPEFGIDMYHIMI